MVRRHFSIDFSFHTGKWDDFAWCIPLESAMRSLDSRNTFICVIYSTVQIHSRGIHDIISGDNEGAGIEDRQSEEGALAGVASDASGEWPSSPHQKYVTICLFASWMGAMCGCYFGVCFWLVFGRKVNSLNVCVCDVCWIRCDKQMVSITETPSEADNLLRIISSPQHLNIHLCPIGLLLFLFVSGCLNFTSIIKSTQMRRPFLLWPIFWDGLGFAVCRFTLHFLIASISRMMF